MQLHSPDDVVTLVKPAIAMDCTHSGITSMPPGTRRDQPVCGTMPPSPLEQNAPSSTHRNPFTHRLRTLVAALVACGAVCVIVGAIAFANSHTTPDTKSILSTIHQASALKITFTALRPSMQLNGKSKATAYIVPRVRSLDSSVLAFDAILTQPGDNVTETYVLLNGHVYWSVSSLEGTFVSAGCLTPSQVPPIQLLQRSLEQSHVASFAEDGASSTMPCDRGQWLEVKFAGETFVLCNSPTNEVSHAVGTDLTFVVEYISDPVQVPDIVAPATDLNCPFVSPAQVQRKQETTSWGDLFRAPATTSLGQASCRCKGRRRPCLFVHGLGMASNGPVRDSLPSYWGQIHAHSPCCESTKFVQMDTVSRGWTDSGIQHDFCRYALQYGANNRGQNEVGDLILVTHSMGNLVAGGAVAAGRCSFSDGVTWVSLAAPFLGTKSANLLEQTCRASAPVKSFLHLLGKCTADWAFLQVKHTSTVDSNLRSLYAAAHAARANHADKKVLCGVSAAGLTADVAMTVVAALSRHDTDNDGIVDFYSCGVGVGGFGGTTTSDNYKASVNHKDASFRHGDGWWGEGRKPVKWFECAL